uniref:Protein RST1 n=1 Tax=Haemonchus contortus TaxID=6289 RepID=A0A7I4XWH2_HAECO
MDADLTSFTQSQDILATLTHHQACNASRREPWIREFKCGRVCFDAVLESPVRASGSSTGSRALPSLREEYADFAQLGSITFPTALLETSNGIEFLFGRCFKVFRRLSASPSIANINEFMQVLGLIEFAGIDVGMADKASSCYSTLLSRLLLKVGPLAKAVSSLPLNVCCQNIPFHAALFSWSCACKLHAVCEKKPMGSKPQANGEGILTADTAFIVLLDGLAALRKNCGSAVPCSCIQSTLIELYTTNSNQLLQSSFRVVQCLVKGESPYDPSQRRALGSLATTPEDFLIFFSEMISHLVDIRVITSDEIMARFVLLAGMSDLLCDTALLPTCKVLLSFLQKYNLKGLAKIRKFASKLVTKILQTVDELDLNELERLSRGEPAKWADYVTHSFSYCVAEEPLLIVFLTKLLSDDQLSSCRGIVINRYSNVKLLVSGCVLSSMLSMLLALVAGIEDWQELSTKMCEWITGAIARANEAQCFVYFNALDVLALITNEKDIGRKAGIFNTVTKCMNSLSLPERSKVFATKYLSLVKSSSKQLACIDVNRFVSVVATPELLEFLYSLTDISAEISGSIWDKAASLLSSRPADSKLREFVVNQLSIGLENRSPHSVMRFKSILEKMNTVHPDADFLFVFCNSILARLPRISSHLVSYMVPPWIYAVLAFSTTREMDTKRFTSLIWDHIMHMLSSIVPCEAMELSPGNSEVFVTKFFMALGNSTASGDTIRKIVADSVPFHLANQIATLLKNDDKELQERIVRICGEIICYVGSNLLSIAEADARRTGLNRTAFVVLTQALVSKMVKSSMDPDFLLQTVPLYVVALAKLPYRIFVYSRIKDLLSKFGDDSAIASRIKVELEFLHGTAHYNQLAKEADDKLRRFISSTDQ